MKKKKFLPQAHYQELFTERLHRLTNLHLKPDTENINPDDEQAVFDHRSMVIKGMHSACGDFMKDLEREYRPELYYRKENVFPRAWMLKDKAIREIVDTHPAFTKLVNYLFNRNRYFRGDELKKMVEEADKLTRGRRYPNEAKYSTFMTNTAFYREVYRKTRIAQNTVQRYLGAFAKIGIVKPLYDSGQYGMLYADGYFRQMPDDTYKKVSFIKDDPAIREGLRRLPKLVRHYNKVRF